MHKNQVARTRLGFGPFLSAGCQLGAAVPAVSYDLGSSYRGLRVTHREFVCIPKPPPHIVNGTRKPVGYASVVYGRCDVQREGPCRPPLDVQSWAECAHNPNSYKPYPGAKAEPEASLNPSEQIGLRTAPQVPAASFEGGTRIELYLGETTVVVFAPSANLARAAADTLAEAVMGSTPRAVISRLVAEANRPGDASTCKNLLAASGSNEG